MADQALEYLKSIFPDVSAPTFHEAIKSGVVLCNLANLIVSNAVPKVDARDIIFVHGANMQHFIQFCRNQQLPDKFLASPLSIVNGEKNAILDVIELVKILAAQSQLGDSAILQGTGKPLPAYAPKIVQASAAAPPQSIPAQVVVEEQLQQQQEQPHQQNSASSQNAPPSMPMPNASDVLQFDEPDFKAYPTFKCAILLMGAEKVGKTTLWMRIHTGSAEFSEVPTVFERSYLHQVDGKLNLCHCQVIKHLKIKQSLLMLLVFKSQYLEYQYQIKVLCLFTSQHIIYQCIYLIIYHTYIINFISRSCLSGNVTIQNINIEKQNQLLTYTVKQVHSSLTLIQQYLQYNHCNFLYDKSRSYFKVKSSALSKYKKLIVQNTDNLYDYSFINDNQFNHKIIIIICSVILWQEKDLIYMLAEY
ncbi:Calponin homology (CH) domain-containing protein [Spironucleus salmonicida]|uniref:Calponin homology (CH) domain-containing protein n=1 Tax=Spironucleus salmonicida TaxID=348837 RepID=V6LAQ3_9EUKA|nr:Calponin homology (CH) domain-containing protein [Spironucleus salmonicida]|eukprot:EST41492.1 Calponin homology (CH) domain-containing protein [Spironucleus salmonicida]